MSHITACATKIALKNKDWIKEAIGLMAAEFPEGILNGKAHPAISFVENEDGIIMVRYAPIETYQKSGNMRFIPAADKSGYTIHLDQYMCKNMVEKVKNSFLVNYQNAGIYAWSARRGYRKTTTKTQTGSRIVCTKW